MVYIGADHNGFWMKEELKAFLQRKRVSFKDMGALKHRKNDDYPDYARRVVAKMKPGDYGLLICGTGQGMAIAANRKRRIRAALASTVFSARKSREDDHANVLVLSAWELSIEKAKRILSVWLATKPSKAVRHIRRLRKINRIKP